MKPCDTNTDYMANKLAAEHTGLGFASTVLASFLGVEGIDDLASNKLAEGSLLSGTALLISGFAIRSFAKGLNYARRQGELDPRHRY